MLTRIKGRALTQQSSTAREGVFGALSLNELHKGDPRRVLPVAQETDFVYWACTAHRLGPFPSRRVSTRLSPEAAQEPPSKFRSFQPRYLCERLTAQGLEEELDAVTVNLLVNVGSINSAAALLPLLYVLGQVLVVYRHNGSLGWEHAKRRVSQQSAVLVQGLEHDQRHLQISTQCRSSLLAGSHPGSPILAPVTCQRCLTAASRTSTGVRIDIEKSDDKL